MTSAKPPGRPGAEGGLTELLEIPDRQLRAPATFTNGRATVLFCSRSRAAEQSHGDLNSIRLRQALSLNCSSSCSPRHRFSPKPNSTGSSSDKSLAIITNCILDHPETHSGIHLRRFVLALYNGHHAADESRLRRRAQHRDREVFTRWMQGSTSESAIRRSLIDSGEMDRWETIRLQAPGQRRLVDAVDAVSDLLNSTLPGEPMTQISRANTLLREVMDELRMGEETTKRG